MAKDNTVPGKAGNACSGRVVGVSLVPRTVTLIGVFCDSLGGLVVEVAVVPVEVFECVLGSFPSVPPERV